MPNFTTLPEDEAEFDTLFGSEPQCRLFVFHLKWPDGFRCPSCQHREATVLMGQRKLVECASCRHQVSLIAGTLFEGTSKDLCLWLRAVFLLKYRDCSALQLHYRLPLAYDTAWRWCAKIRAALAEPAEPAAPQAETTGPTRAEHTLAAAGLSRPEWHRPDPLHGCTCQGTLLQHDWSADPEDPWVAEVVGTVRRACSSKMSEKHYQRYLDFAAVRLASEHRFAFVPFLAAMLVRTRPITYREIVGHRSPRGELTVAGFAVERRRCATHGLVRVGS